MNELKQERAVDIFKSEFATTRDLNQAIRAVLLDIDTRAQVSQMHVGDLPKRSLLIKYRKFVEDVCELTGADLETVCSINRGSIKVTHARRVIAGVFTDLNYTSGAIMDGFGIGQSVIQTAKLLKAERPEWGKMIQVFLQKLKGE